MYLFLLLFPDYIPIWGAKVHIFFELTKNYAIFTQNFYAFFYFYCTFAPENRNYLNKLDRSYD